MARFIIRRLIQMIGVVFALSLLLFFWLRSLPGGVVSAILGERATPASRAALTEAFGLDQPVYVQYLKFLQRAARGEFGASTSVLPGRDAFDIFLTRLPATIELSICAMVIAVVFAIPLGYLAAKRQGLDVRQRHDRDVAHRRGRPGVLPRVPAQVLVRRRTPRSSPCPAGRTPHWAAPGSPASSCSTGC